MLAIRVQDETGGNTEMGFLNCQVGRGNLGAPFVCEEHLEDIPKDDQKRSAKTEASSGSDTKGVKSETMKDKVASESVGDVWQFLGFDDAGGSELELTAQLQLQAQRLIKGKKQLSVAKLLGTSQPRVSDLKRWNIDKFSASALHGFLQKLDPDARYVITRVPRERRSGTERRSGERKRKSA